LPKEKLAIVTGASRRLGFEISREIAQRGATVIVYSRNRASAEKSPCLIKGNIYPEKVDVTNTHAIAQFVRHIAERHRRIHILVNNAGFSFDCRMQNKRFHEVAEEDFERIIDVDANGIFRFSQAAIPLMMKNNVSSSRGDGGGVIINIASTPPIAGHTAGAPYSIAKSGLIAITKHIALEYGDKNIRSYILALGNVSTEATFASMTLTERKKAAMENSMKRWGYPREVGTIAASIASGDFAFATRNTIVIDGGRVML
jgi:3-oxoacyl-[acyl-carrier protein] reductase